MRLLRGLRKVWGGNLIERQGKKRRRDKKCKAVGPQLRCPSTKILHMSPKGGIVPPFASK